VIRRIATVVGAVGLLFPADAFAQGIGPQRDPTAARRQLDEVLALPVFKGQDWIDALPGWLVPAALLVRALVELVWNVVRWPFDRFIDFITRLVGDVLRGPVVVVLALLVIAGLVLLYQRGLRSAIVRQAEVRAEDGPLPPTAAEAISLASREANAGRYREACHFVLLSALLQIEERGAARFDPSATNREHLARVARAPRLAGALERVVARFDRVWYGQDNVTEADYRELLALAGGVAQVTA